MNTFSLEDIAREYEITVDYLCDEFIIDDCFMLCDTFIAIIDEVPIILSFDAGQF